MKLMDRRSLLGGLGGALAGLAIGRVGSAAATWCAPPGAQMWSTLGLSGNVTLPAGLVVLDVSASVQSLTIPAGSTLMFHPDYSITLESSGNVIVAGVLDAQPASSSQAHRIKFVGINEEAVVGGGCIPLATDVGLWVIDGGRLNIVGTAKRSWCRLTAPVVAGATSIVVEDATGWQPGDRLIIAPMAGYEAYSDATVAAVAGNTVTVSALQNAHTMSPPWNGAPLGAEVCNLTRNVIVEGAAPGRAHIMIHSTVAQTIRHLEGRFLGPRHATGVIRGGQPLYTSVLGRYALHFHSCQDGSRGSIVEGVAIHDIGSKAFVPHASHGVTFRDCIAHNGWNELYWWDQTDRTFDNVYERCVASLSTPEDLRGYRNAGVNMSPGFNCKFVDSAIFGVKGRVSASGLLWPEANSGLWETHGNVIHNNETCGIFVWQNTERPHFVSDTFIYRCPVGVKNGAYLNSYRYERVTVRDCDLAIMPVAVSYPNQPAQPQRWVDCVFGATGPFVADPQGHTFPSTIPTEFHRCTFDGATGYHPLPHATLSEMIDFIDCTFTAARYQIDPATSAATALRFQNAGTATRATVAGETPVAPFWTGPPLPPGAFVAGDPPTYTYICGIGG